ncbi:translocation and assembly module lipoprotein TamL [Fulvivirga lutea]|uniref:BamA/TamA family outer membrane protein n=1 Tax=Fulvivirga lutea TaxID=2810512 RepID=A0A974WFA1_9BACT|nr:BamA/TamA family outer membrane protein [Fulvivirga lutea]QSE96900.1 BamA/TamA family outer membrane protein [Fulvivirga lutea]
MRHLKRISLYFFTSLLLSGCLGTKYLKEDENLLFKQNIKVGKAIDSDDLEQLYAQEPNRQFPLIPFAPYVWFYYWGKKSYDIEKYQAKKAEIAGKFSKKIKAAEKRSKRIKLERKQRRKLAKIDKTIEEGNTLMRWGEPLAVYDSSLTQSTIDRFELYLDSKGYFHSKIKHKTSSIGSRISSTYIIDEGPAYIVDTLFTQTGDSAITELLKKTEKKSHLKTGENYEQGNITKERERIDLLLKDNGYFNFSRQYVQFEVDTAFRESHNVAIKTLINRPSKRDRHKVFHVDSINFITDANVKSLPDSMRITEQYKGVSYRYYDPQYSKKVLNRRVFIRKDSLYSKSRSYNTQRQLANLDHFRFININYDSSGGKLIANIFTSPLSRYQWTNEVGINVTQGYPGPFYNISFKKRNIFKGLEIFEMNGRIGIEGVASVSGAEEVYRSVESGVNASLTFPQFILPISSSLKERLGQVNPKTRLLAGYTYTNRPEYQRNNTNFSNTYSWQNSRNTSYQVTLTDVSLIESSVDSTFGARLNQLERNGNRLINTFRPSLVTSMSANATWNFNSYGLNFSNSSFLRVFLESGGTTLNFINTEFLERESLEFYKFYKINIDFRKINPINKNTTIAYRVNAGYANPYGENGILPYEKYFFAGGSNGIRAWRPRRLGPGSFVEIDTLTNEVNYDFEQPGEIIFEGSIELRKNLIGFIDYAFFVDFGNTWTIEVDESRPGAEFNPKTFFEQLAVGTGFGLRFDFSFLVLRLDAGLKVYDPARPLEKRFILNEGFYDAPFTRDATEPIIFNIGIGYPF